MVPAFNPYALAFGLVFLGLGLFGLSRVRRLTASPPFYRNALRVGVALVAPALVLAGLLFIGFAFYPPDF